MANEIKGFKDILAVEAYRSALTSAKEELDAKRQRMEEILTEQGALEQRIMELRRTVAALSELCGERFNEDDEFGLTDSIRMALKTHGGGLNAQQVKARLEQLGYKTESTNLLASIHTILKRLVLKGELDDQMISDGKAAYRWIKK